MICIGIQRTFLMGVEMGEEKHCPFDSYDLLNITMLHRIIYHPSMAVKYLQKNDFLFPGHESQ
jgi:hypothetical protein